jgi:hypothetical protein
MDLSNNNNHIVVYADKLYIGEIDFGQHNTLEIHPYTPGQRVYCDILFSKEHTIYSFLYKS